MFSNSIYYSVLNVGVQPVFLLVDDCCFPTPLTFFLASTTVGLTESGNYKSKGQISVILAFGSLRHDPEYDFEAILGYIVRSGGQLVVHNEILSQKE